MAKRKSTKAEREERRRERERALDHVQREALGEHLAHEQQPGDMLTAVVAGAPDQSRRLQQSASVRVRPMPHFAVIHRGRQLSLDATVTEVGLAALDRIDVVEARL